MKIAILLGLFAISLGFVQFEIEPIDMSTTTLKVTEEYFDNYKDHFNKLQLGTYKQRYWEMMDYWKADLPKAILYICGESKGRFPGENTLPLLAAKEVGAAVYSLEHRFYGESQPTANWTLEDLKLLTFQQGLADIAYFIESMNVKLKEKYGAAPKWVVIGGSYAGAMSAWFRFNYPHIAVGSISSSGVVNAIDDFQDYEKQVIIGLNKCNDKVVKQLKEYHDYADLKLSDKDPNARTAFLKLFNATDMEALDFLYYFADIPVAWIQRGRRLELCKILEDLKGDIDSQIKKLADLTADTGHTAIKYKLSTLTNTTIDSGKNSRQWYYQVCTTFGWFQTAYVANRIRSPNMNLTYWREYCKTIFPGAILFPDVRITNLHMGGVGIEKFTSNTFFTQGIDDGWKWAGIMGTFENERNTIKEIDCNDCAHCMDLRAESSNDPPVLKETRQKEIQAISKWLS